MRDTVIARRTLLALVAVAAVAGCAVASAAAQPAGKRKPHRPSAPHPPTQRVVALDPGHGGVDPGAISPRGIYEKNITLTTARELARQLDASGRYRAVLTRNRDVFVPLRERVARARLHHAELLLSIHADALPDRGQRGLSVYTLSDQASDRETAALAERENRDDFVAGLKLSRQPREIGAILLDLARRQTNNRSLTLARAVVGELGHAVPLLEKPHRSAGFVVLKAPDVPSALVELGCLSNRDEERLLPRHAYQHRLAQALLRAIDDYFAAVIAA
jgi:N-acetylmuramoyl-L-alanine amidase